MVTSSRWRASHSFRPSRLDRVRGAGRLEVPPREGGVPRQQGHAAAFGPSAPAGRRPRGDNQQGGVARGWNLPQAAAVAGQAAENVRLNALLLLNHLKRTQICRPLLGYSLDETEIFMRRSPWKPGLSLTFRREMSIIILL